MEHFKSKFGYDIFNLKYAQYPGETWTKRCRAIVQEICSGIMTDSECGEIYQYLKKMAWMPGGRYIYYCGRPLKYINNCYLLKCEEDTREEWSNVVWRAMSCLMTGGGIGIDYSNLRPSGSPLKRTGGIASGPIPLMHAINEIGRNVMQGGSRRSAIYASLNWLHADVNQFLKIKNWSRELRELKAKDFNFPAPLDMTNISLNYDDNWLNQLSRDSDTTWLENCRQAMMTGEPGFSFNFGDKSSETLRNACTEVTSSDDSDVCNLGSINLGNIDTLEDFKSIVHLATKFLVCGTLRADLPYRKVALVREKNRRLGLGLMGIHEWLLRRGYRYEVVPELHKWLSVYRDESDRTANEFCNSLSISPTKANRAIAPTGSLAILASTTGGIEPLYAVAYQRRYLTEGTKWKHQYIIDSTAERLINDGIRPDDIETAGTLARDFERRIKFQADVQAYVDMGISSTINLDPWGSEYNSESKVGDFARTLAKYAPRLRGFTAYPSGARDGQPLEAIDYYTAKRYNSTSLEDNGDSCSLSGKGFCGM